MWMFLFLFLSKTPWSALRSMSTQQKTIKRLPRCADRCFRSIRGFSQRTVRLSGLPSPPRTGYQERLMLWSKVLFFSQLLQFQNTQSWGGGGRTAVINNISAQMHFIGDILYGQTDRNRVARLKKGLDWSTIDRPLTAQTCQCQLKPSRVGYQTAVSLTHMCICACFTFICGDAPRSEQCQTPNPRPCHQPNATTPPARLHGASK